MKLRWIKEDLSVCQVKDIHDIDFGDSLWFISKTDEELSLVCSTNCVPKDVIACESGWRAFRIEGVLDFSLIGILSKITTLLAEHTIGVFVVSTYNTDYILVKEENVDYTTRVLAEAKYEWEDKNA